MMAVASSFDKWTDRHNTRCEVCNLGGDLVDCGFCNLVYHPACLDPPLEPIPELRPLGPWACPACALEQAGGTADGPLGFDPRAYEAIARLCVQEPDGEWRRNVTLFGRKGSPEEVVLWFGGTEFEGLQRDYTYRMDEGRDAAVLRDGMKPKGELRLCDDASEILRTRDREQRPGFLRWVTL